MDLASRMRRINILLTSHLVWKRRIRKVVWLIIRIRRCWIIYRFLNNFKWKLYENKNLIWRRRLNRNIIVNLISVTTLQWNNRLTLKEKMDLKRLKLKFTCCSTGFPDDSSGGAEGVFPLSIFYLFNWVRIKKENQSVFNIINLKNNILILWLGRWKWSDL